VTTRSGIGFDVHPLIEGVPLVLGGVAVPFDKGLAGHSDGDVLVHAIIDALLGGAGLGDIGVHFPSTDSSLEGIDSRELLARTIRLLAESSWRATYVDATIIAARPALRPFIARMSASLGSFLGFENDQVNLKATTTDGLGFIGRGEGIAVIAIATIEPSE
jgi:2-C-methyl-D-erythritol 2,4-cyclodiphosphate synthase